MQVESQVTDNQKSGCRGLFWRSAALALLGTLLVASVPLVLGYWFFARPFLSSSPTSEKDTERVVSAPGANDGGAVSKEEVQRSARAKSMAMERALFTGQRDTFRFSEEELNAILRVSMRRGLLEGEAAVQLRDDGLVVDASVPLRGVPFLGDTHLVAVAEMQVALENDVLDLYITRIRPRGTNAASAAFLQGLRGQNLADVFADAPFVEDVKKGFETIRIKDGQLLVTTRERTRNDVKKGSEVNSNGSSVTEMPDD